MDSQHVSTHVSLVAHLDRLRIRHALVVTDERAVESGLLHALSGALPDRFELTLFKETPEHPSEAVAGEAAELFVLLHCDGIIGLGGPTPRTLARLVGLLATHHGPLSRHLTGDGAWLQEVGPLPPLVTVSDAVPSPYGPDSCMPVELRDGRRVRIKADDDSVCVTLPVDGSGRLGG